MKTLFRIAAYAVMLAAAAAILAASGVIPVTVSPGDWAVTRAVMQFAKRRSITTHSLGVRAPSLDSPSLVLKGAGHFETTCRSCHGAPPFPRTPLALGMDPSPPNLASRAPSWSDGELFSIAGFTVRGGKITGIDILADPDRVRRLHLTILDR